MRREKYAVREFVYLDDETAINHLASSGEGIPEEVVETTTEQESRRVTFGLNLLSEAAAGLQGQRVTGEGIETVRRVEAPFIYDRLERVIQSEVDDRSYRKGKSGERLLGDRPVTRSDFHRGDPVVVNGTVEPVSLGTFALGVQSLRELERSDEKAVLRRLSESDANGVLQPPEPLPSDRSYMTWLLEKYTDGRLPVKVVQRDGTAIYTALRLDKLWSDPRSIVSAETGYTLFGRVETTLGPDDSWDPVLAIAAAESLTDDANAVEDFRKAVVNAADELGIEMTDADMRGDSGAAVVHPIAVHW